jgi:hypothetical protein
VANILGVLRLPSLLRRYGFVQDDSAPQAFSVPDSQWWESSLPRRTTYPAGPTSLSTAGDCSPSHSGWCAVESKWAEDLNSSYSPRAATFSVRASSAVCPSL